MPIENVAAETGGANALARKVVVSLRGMDYGFRGSRHVRTPQVDGGMGLAQLQERRRYGKRGHSTRASPLGEALAVRRANRSHTLVSARGVNRQGAGEVALKLHLPSDLASDSRCKAFMTNDLWVRGGFVRWSIPCTLNRFPHHQAVSIISYSKRIYMWRPEPSGFRICS